MQHIRERLLTRRTQHESDVRARRGQQLLDGVGDRDVIPTPMQLLQQLQRVNDRTEMRQRRRLWRNSKRMKAREPELPVEQLLIATP